MSRTLVFNNTFLPPKIQLYESGKLRKQKEIDSIEEELFSLLDKSCSAFDALKIKRLIKKALDTFEYESIEIKEKEKADGS